MSEDSKRAMIAVSLNHKNKLKKLCVNTIPLGAAVEYMIDQAVKGKIKIPKK